jgi:hypothetical protein
MKPKWKFEMIMWSEIGLWIVTMIGVVMAIMGIAYFLTIYNIFELLEFGDLGWQIFYEDFPYIWGFVAIFSLIIGLLLMVKFGDNYKRSWQKNLMIMSGIILIMTIVGLFLKL